VNALALDAVEVWHLPIGDDSSHPWAAYEYMLCSEEAAKASHFVRRDDRRHYTAAHALLRVMLSSFVEVAPEAWRFVKGPQGRPEIAPDLSPLPLRFSLSHTDQLVAATVTLNRPVGLDVEFIERSIDDVDGVIAFFAEEEIRFLHGCGGPGRRRAFFEVWTMKEAFVKATGLGLSLPLDQFSVTLEPSRLLFSPAHWGAPNAWQFCLNQPSSAHQMAIVAQAEPGTTLKFKISAVAPGRLTPE
jgi:4'-phosphopantetheinyl transferase